MQGGYNIVCIPREEVTFECRLLNIITIDRTKKSDMGERFFFFNLEGFLVNLLHCTLYENV
ncbi:hypothetical protein PEXP_005750 [Penicillium expansum]|nr:hypothetical protein PEXP_005750 [Penicillium expansum]